MPPQFKKQKQSQPVLFELGYLQNEDFRHHQVKVQILNSRQGCIAKHPAELRGQPKDITWNAATLSPKKKSSRKHKHWITKERFDLRREEKWRK